jgi:hypothetical protein
VEPSYFAPLPVGEVLSRCCQTLTFQYSRRGDAVRARLFRSFVNEFNETYGRRTHS